MCAACSADAPTVSGEADMAVIDNGVASSEAQRQPAVPQEALPGQVTQNSAGTSGQAQMQTSTIPAAAISAAADNMAGTSSAAADAGVALSAIDAATEAAEPEMLGPVNGDPDKPVVELDEVACRTEAELSGRGGSSVNMMIDGRGLVIDYPCGKHEGAQMTVIVNLHGTLAFGAPFTYQRSYFSAYRLVSSHNLIVVHPQSRSNFAVGAQWGNEDNGTDTPHLNEVMKWV